MECREPDHLSVTKAHTSLAEDDESVTAGPGPNAATGRLPIEDLPTAFYCLFDWVRFINNQAACQVVVLETARTASQLFNSVDTGL